VNEKEISNVTDKRFALGDVAKETFISVNLAGKRRKSYYIAEAMNDFNGYKCEIRYYKQLDNTNKFIHDRNKINISALLQ
jgi:hypothetical protein